MRTITGLTFALLLAVMCLPSAAQAPADVQDCSPTGDLKFVCGAQKPEDLAHIPGTKWLIASGFSDGAGLKLVDTDNKSLRLWYDGSASQIAQDRGLFGACPSAPDVGQFNAHGINLKPKSDGRYTLYVVNHGGRQSIEVFTVDARGAVPALVWNGCVVMPEGLSANSVAAYSDGTILASVLTHPGTSIADFVNGKKTGGIYQWRPGDVAFSLLAGTELPGNNGLEVSRDDSEFYVVAFGLHAVVIFSRADPSKPARQAVAPGFMPDNVHWDGERLIAAGMMYDEPACGGLRKVINGVADGMQCHRGYVAAQLDPKTMAFRILSYGEPNAAYNGVASAVIIGNTLWLGSYQSDRIAYRTLPYPLP